MPQIKLNFASKYIYLTRDLCKYTGCCTGGCKYTTLVHYKLWLSYEYGAFDNTSHFIYFSNGSIILAYHVKVVKEGIANLKGLGLF